MFSRLTQFEGRSVLCNPVKHVKCFSGTMNGHFKHLSILVRHVSALGLFCLLMCQNAVADKIELIESYSSDTTYNCQATVSSQGEVFFTNSETKDQREKLSANASFSFLERRLPPAGRDSLAFRSVRDFQSAQMVTTVGGHRTEVKLPENATFIVSDGYREGVRHYSPLVKLSRDSLDLLEIPGDPLVLAALLPPNAVEVEDEWKPSDWVLQMLTGIEAVETSELKCQLSASNSISAKITFSGKIKGQRFGASTEVEVRGTLIFDLRTSHVARTQAIYKISAGIGTVYPGLDIEVTSNLVRNVSEEKGRLTDAIVEDVPLDPSENMKQLTFEAPPWGVTIEHGRGWHLFNSVMEGANQVAIFRLVEHGSLVCQCNFSPLLKAAPGEITPLEQFEADIQKSLGKAFKSVIKSEQLPTENGKQILRVAVEGEHEVKGQKGSALIPMTWIYYIVADRTGQQLSFVFAVESPLVEQLGDRDREIVKNLRFVTPQR